MHCGGMTQLVREVHRQKPNTRSFVNERLAAVATGPLFRVSHLETPPAPAFKRVGLKAVCATVRRPLGAFDLDQIKRPVVVYHQKARVMVPDNGSVHDPRCLTLHAFALS